MSELAESKLVDIWNYLADTKELIGISNAYEDALPAHCTTIKPPAKIAEGKKAYFDESAQKWNVKSLLLSAEKGVKVYSYLAGTGELLGSHIATGAITGHCTDIEPGQPTAPGRVMVFDTEAQQWTEQEDHRGEIVYSTQSARPQYIDALGPYPADTTPLAPLVAFPVWSGSEWVMNTAAQRKAAIRANVKKYQRLINQINRAICPLTTGRELSPEELTTLAALREYATQLAAFIQTADLADKELVLPVAGAGLLDYPYSLNPSYEVD